MALGTKVPAGKSGNWSICCTLELGMTSFSGDAFVVLSVGTALIVFFRMSLSKVCEG